MADNGPAVPDNGPTCAYVIEHLDSYTVATPALYILVPDSDAAIQPVAVHLDETTQSIIGYSLRAPGGNAASYGSGVYVPGVSQYIPSFSATVPQTNITPSRCVNIDSVSTPAIPIRIPASVLTLPGATADVGGIVLNIVGNPVTAAGKFFQFNGKTIVIPDQSTTVHSVPVGTPNESIVVNVNGTLETAHYLAPK